jgi:hypothetical protein
VVSGPQVRSALGLRDTWFTHYRVSSSASSAHLARSAGLARSAPRRVLAGEFRPTPRKRLLVVERRAGNRFRAIRKVRTSRLGRYSVLLRRSGTYRVRHRTVAGPAVRVR